MIGWKILLAWMRRNAVGLLAGLAVLLVVIVLAVQLGRWRAQSVAAEAVQSRAGAEVAQAGDRASAAAGEAVAGLGERELARAAKDRENRDEILRAPNARDDAGAAGDAGLVGLCRRPAYRDHPRCAGLRQPGSAPAS
jgi:hypothetical protein